MGKRSRAASCTVADRPAGPAVETRLVLVLALLAAAVCAGVVAFCHGSANFGNKPDGQLEAISPLRPKERTSCNALCFAVPKIGTLFAEKVRWPTVGAPGGECLPPFVHDAAWRANGRLIGTRSVLLLPDLHAALYVGHPEDATVSGTFSLLPRLYAG